MKKKRPCGFSFGTAGVQKETSDAIKVSSAATRLKKNRESAFFYLILAPLSCVVLTKVTVVTERDADCM